MKLRDRIQLRLLAVLAVVLAAWAALFYQTIVYEINDETDDSLEDYTETIVKRFLRGEELPDSSTGSNNQYYITPATQAEANRSPSVVYADTMVFIREKGETEPARMLTTLFKDEAGKLYSLHVFIPTFEKKELKAAILTWAVVLYALLLLSVLAVNMLVFHSSMKPFYRIIRWLQRAHLDGRTTLPDTPTHVSEFRTLHHALADYTHRAERTYEQQKAFIGDASHEMQTPLAICLNRIEYLLEDTQPTEKQSEELQKIQQTLGRMSRLNKNLLLLSKLDNGQYPDTKPVPLNGIFRQLADDFGEVYAHLNIEVQMNENAEFPVSVDETLGTLLAANLLKNAFVHNRAKEGKIRINIEADTLTVANTGEAAPLDGQLIFQRFYHKGGKKGSTGLGLAIAQAVAQKYGMEIIYRYADGWHFFQLSRKKD